MKKSDIGSLAKSAKRAAVPIIAIETVDPAQTIKACLKSLVNGVTLGMIEWDCNRGLFAFQEDTASSKIIREEIGQDADYPLADPGQMLTALLKMSSPSVVFMHGAHRFLESPQTAQGVWNIRDKFKTGGSMLVLLGPAFQIPLQLQQDVVLLTEDLPTKEEVVAIIKRVIKDANRALQNKERPKVEVTDEEYGRYADTLTGLSAFTVEQQFSMSISPGDPPHVDESQLWQRKRKQVSMTAGLSIEKPVVKISDLRGCSQIVKFGSQLMLGRRPPTCIWLIDEIEKSLAGIAGDTSGTSQDQLGVLLTEMQDYGLTGWIEVGPPGAAKTYFPQCLAGEFKIPFGRLDLGGMKGGLVGQSEALIRQAMKVARAISDGRGIFVATCNNITTLPPELRRRFTLGTWFFPLPSAEEVTLMWELYIEKYELQHQKLPECPGWTGAEVKACCDIAWRTSLSIVEAAEYIVPVSRAAKSTIDKLYDMADGTFLDANKPGTFQKPKAGPSGSNMDL